jgi:hypothetical protein
MQVVRNETKNFKVLELCHGSLWDVNGDIITKWIFGIKAVRICTGFDLFKLRFYSWNIVVMMMKFCSN